MMMIVVWGSQSICYRGCYRGVLQNNHRHKGLVYDEDCYRGFLEYGVATISKAP